ncbi:unnamed protein product [Pieris macdunnoughi]|uniref:Uncharacterized protein n=1 Tax=Pieris macdunnoughi TaxID=345717 RepID=A0A821R2L5_9NEOP|nr:unnamed protein product [Pieris macdunnoughi]
MTPASRVKIYTRTIDTSLKLKPNCRSLRLAWLLYRAYKVENCLEKSRNRLWKLRVSTYASNRKFGTIAISLARTIYPVDKPPPRCRRRRAAGRGASSRKRM